MAKIFEKKCFETCLSKIGQSHNSAEEQNTYDSSETTNRNTSDDDCIPEMQTGGKRKTSPPEYSIKLYLRD